MNNKERIEKIFQDYNFIQFPKEYKQTLILFLDLAQQIFKDNLLSITLGGSGGKNKIIDNSSDLDIYVVLKRYNISQVAKLQNILDDNKIHIGLTFYNLEEIDNNLIDFKTKIMIYEKYTFKVNPTLYGNDYFKTINYQEVYENDSMNYPQVLQAFKRMYIEVLNNKRKIDKTYIKKMVVVLKCILTSHNIFTYGYNSVYQEFIKLSKTNIKTYNFEDIIKNLDNNINFIIELSNNIINYTEDEVMFKKDKYQKIKRIKEVV